MACALLREVATAIWAAAFWDARPWARPAIIERITTLDQDTVCGIQPKLTLNRQALRLTVLLAGARLF